MNDRKSALIVRTGDDIKQARQAAASFLLCVNDAVFETCRQLGLDACLLDEHLLRPDFQAINTWAYDKTFRFIEKIKSDRKKYIFFQSNFVDVQRVFVQGLKNKLVFDQVLSRNNVREVTIAENSASFLSITLESFAKNFYPQLSISFTSRSPSPEAGKRDLSSPALAKKMAAALLGSTAHALGMRSVRKWSSQKRRFVLASGGINHLGETLIQLQNKYGFEVAYAENEFNLTKLKFCLANRMACLIIPKPRSPFGCADKDLPALESAELEFKGVDYSCFFENVFNNYFKLGIVAFPYDYDWLARFYSDYPPARILLDEDLVMRRMLGVADPLSRYYVVSHGIPGGLLESDPASPKGRYISGTTFASGEFEKLEYDKIYFDLKKVAMTGVPRYDRLYELKRAMIKTGVPKKILYCGASMKAFSFENMFTMLGFKNFFGEYSKKYLKDVLEIFRGQEGVRLNIKPHYHEEGEWQSAMGKVPEHIQLLSHQDDIFKLESEADLVVTVESSVIIEAIMLDKPVIVLNYTEQGLLSDYDRHGLVEHVRDKAQLQAAIQKCLYDEVYLRELTDKRKKYFSHYAAYFDGRNKERVAEAIAAEAQYVR